MLTQNTNGPKFQLRRKALLGLIRKHPGLNARELVNVGWKYAVHGSLADAERRGLIEWQDGGWFITAKKGPSNDPKKGYEEDDEEAAEA